MNVAGNVYGGFIVRHLFLHGAKDPLVPNFHADVLHTGIAGSRLHFFPEGKHNIHQAYAQEFNRMLVEFLTHNSL